MNRRREDNPIHVAQATSGRSNPDETFSGSARDPDRHFKDLCLLYGDSNRPVFLREFLRWFVRNANKTELAELRKAVALRAGKIGKVRRRGRPHAEEDVDWLVKARTAAWRRIVEGRTWAKIAESEGMKPNKDNIKTIERTLSRRQDQFASIIWDACFTAGIWQTSADIATDMASLKRNLEAPQFRRWLWSRTGLPFDLFLPTDYNEECKKIVLTLVPRGLKAVSQKVVRELKYERKKLK